MKINMIYTSELYENNNLLIRFFIVQFLQNLRQNNHRIHILSKVIL